MKGEEWYISEIVRMHFNEDDWETGNDVYHECLQKINKVALKDFSEEKVQEIIRPYLYKWGMGRVLGQEQYNGWQLRLSKAIRKYQKNIKKYRRNQLGQGKIEKFDNEIITLYQDINKIIGPVATGKVLHILCPNFFPLWDRSIADNIREVEWIESEDKVTEFSAEDYVMFMKKIQYLSEKHDSIFTILENKYNENRLRIIDNFLWWATRKTFTIIK